ncbi:HNH endonuclease [Streptomyces pseudogriseolus]|uniref:HNH endonuclease n=1 Tax=Streptomyces pseudogriseolus TaxID=36817 RepID=UPI003FA2F810
MRPEHTTCIHCGSQTKIAGDGPIPKYCSSRCRAAYNRARAKETGKFAEWEARRLARQAEAAAAREAARLASARPCPYCGAPMTHPRRVQCGAPECKRRFTNDRAREFQRRYKEVHGNYHSRQYDRGKKRQYSITCAHCGREATVTKASAQYCSHQCFYDGRYGEGRPRENTREATKLRRQAKAAARLEKAANGVRGKGVWTTGRCSNCGTDFTRHSFSTPATHCSSECRRSDRVLLRRALQRDLDAGRVSRIAIYQRDDWTCHICGDPVDRDAVVPDLAAPVLDHVVPLARRGKHSEDNLKTAHFYCNSVKRDLVDGWSALAS